jgi:hypothetical protein
VDRSELWREDALDYAGDHAGRVPFVMAARVARTWSIYPLSPREKANHGAFLFRHIYELEYAAMASFAIVLVLAAAGLGLVRRAGAAAWLLAAPLVLVTVVSALGYGDTRFRQAAEVALVVLAAAGVERLLSGRARRRAVAEARVRDSARSSSVTAPTATQCAPRCSAA